MIYCLQFAESALKEWRKLAAGIREQLKAKLAERLRNPHVPSARLHGMKDCYKIKLRAAGYRFVYQVDDKVIVVIGIAVGKRDRGEVYSLAVKRTGK